MRPFRILGGRAVARLALGLWATVALGQQDSERVEGFVVGPWIIAPSVVAGASYDTNVLRRNPSFALPPDAEVVTTVSPVVTGALPFRNSRITFGYSGTWSNFSETEIDRNWAQELSAEADLTFGSSDVIRGSFVRTDGIAETLNFDPGGEVVFEGNSYTLDAATATIGRAIAGRRGYHAVLRHERLEFDPGTTPSFFNFNGYAWEATYREPTTPRTWLEATYSGRRYDQFLANRPDLAGTPFRQELTDTMWGGMAGTLGTRGAFRARAGWTALRFERTVGKNFTGLVLDGTADLAVGGGSRIKLVVSRQALPSFFFDNNYYVATGFGAGLERVSATGSVIGGLVGLARTRYDEPVLEEDGAAPLFRRDRLVRVQVYATVPVRRFFGLRVSAEHQYRRSPYVPARFRQTVIFGGFWFGWLQ